MFKFQVRSQRRRFFKGVIAICLISGMLLSLIVICSFNFALASDDSEPLIPLIDMGNSTYYGYEGGLYPNDSNTMPISHLLDGIALSEQVVPRDVYGQPSALGKIVLLSIGMSIAMQEFDEFMQLSANDFSLNSSLVLVNGAEGGMVASKIQDPNDNSTGTQYWNYVDQELIQSGVTRMQVQAVWLKQADLAPSGSSIVYAQTLEQEIIKIVHVLSNRFPNLKLLYLSSRSYGGYATTPAINPEPYAYASGFSVKWIIEAQINGTAELNCNPEIGEVEAPWMAWGPYLWADGSIPRSDGLTWQASDFSSSDGTHPSTQGSLKVAIMLLNFFKSDSTSQPWFLASQETPYSPPAPAISPRTQTSATSPASSSPDNNPSPSPSPISTPAIPEFSTWVIVVIIVIAPFLLLVRMKMRLVHRIEK